MQYIGKLNPKMLGKYSNICLTDEVVLTNERLYEHILLKHKNDYEMLYPYLKDIVENPDVVIEDNKKENTLILLKDISNIQKREISNKNSSCKRPNTS